MDTSKQRGHLAIYITIMVFALLKCLHCQYYRDMQGLTLLPGSSLRDNNDVRSLIECIVLCKQIGGECYAVSWNETATSCSCHHWLKNGTNPEEFSGIEMTYGSDEDHVVLLQPILVLHTETSYSFNYAAGEAFCLSIGATVASLDQLTEAMNSGYYRCACGLVTDGKAHYPMTFSQNGCGSPGMNLCDRDGLFDVYCSTIPHTNSP